LESLDYDIFKIAKHQKYKFTLPYIKYIQVQHTYYIYIYIYIYTHTGVTYLVLHARQL